MVLKFLFFITLNSLQQQIMFFSEPINQTLTFSQIRSATGQQLFHSRVGNYHSLPHVTQPILAKYRMPRNPNELVIEQSSSFWCKLFNISSPQTISLCKCDRTEEGHCMMIMRWINEFYDWKGDLKFVKAYQSYTRRNIDIFLTDAELGNRLDKKLQILGVKLGEKHRNTLLKVCKNYLKHTIYYGKSDQLTRQNDLWMWFILGVFYHIGTSFNQQKINQNYQEEIMFWSVDIIMNSLGTITRPVLQKHIIKIKDLMKEYFPNWYKKIVEQYAIDLEPIVYEWINEMMMGYMGIQSIGFFMDCLLKSGWNYVIKLILSYIEKRMEKMDNDQIFQSVTDREVITRELTNCKEEWPLIFCNANSFNFEAQQNAAQ